MEKISLNPTNAAVHPFYPLGANIVGYIANDWSVPTLLGVFFGGWVVILGVVLALVRRFNPSLSGQEKSALLWFVLTGTIHLFFEGYFSVNHASMAGKQSFFGQLWKEYSFSDSRYLTSDPFVLCMETVTAFLWGPLSFVVATMIAAEHPLRHPLQAMVSLGQIYGLILYYATCMFDHYYKDLTYCRPEAYYFWLYFFLVNFIWIVIPGTLLYDSISKTGKAFAVMARETKKEQTSGHVKKTS